MNSKRFETLSSSDICLLLIGNAINPKKERGKLLLQLEDKLDMTSWCMIVMQAIQQALDTNHRRIEESCLAGIIPSKAIYRLFKYALDFNPTYQKLLISLWNNEVTKLEMTAMDQSCKILSSKYRIKISFLVFSIIKDLLVESRIYLEELHTFFTFLQLNFVGNFSLLHSNNWISSLFGKKVLCPAARNLLSEILQKCHEEVYREICLYIFNNPEMLNAAKLVDQNMFKIICSRYLKFGKTKTIIFHK